MNTGAMIEAPGYYEQDRSSLLRLVDGVPGSVLEVGCASGVLLKHWIDIGATPVTGVEYVPEVAQIAAANNPKARVLVGDVDSHSEADLGSNYDLAVMSFVLEHVTDPWKTLARIVDRLRPGGQLVGALPNVRHLSVTLPLLFRGRWDYVDDGILDRTHYRFFTRDTIIALLKSAGLQDIRLQPQISAGKSGLVNRVTLGRLEEHFAYAYEFSGIKR